MRIYNLLERGKIPVVQVFLKILLYGGILYYEYVSVLTNKCKLNLWFIFEGVPSRRCQYIPLGD